MNKTILLLPLVCLGLLVGCGRAPENETNGGGGDQAAAEVADWRAAARGAVDRGAQYLLGQRTDEGYWQFMPGTPADLGISGLAAWGLLETKGAAVKNDMKPVLDWFAENQKEDGSVFIDRFATYNTSMAVMAMVTDGDPKYRPVIEKAMQFIRRIQADEGEGRDESSEDYGGVGYGSGGPASGVVNLSTTHFAVEAAKEAGVKDEAFYSKALRFLERSQNRSESNDTTHKETVDGQEVEVTSGNDGGGIYRPGESKAGIQKLPDGRFVYRSYGSMTYALLKSYVFCDLDARDPRVEAAIRWISENWELDWNPGMEHSGEDEASRYQGLYYYYLTIGRCLAACEAQKIELPPVLANWREDLARKLLALQREDGSWANTHQRWMESSGVLSSAYALLALAECLGEAD